MSSVISNDQRSFQVDLHGDSEGSTGVTSTFYSQDRICNLDETNRPLVDHHRKIVATINERLQRLAVYFISWIADRSFFLRSLDILVSLRLLFFFFSFSLFLLSVRNAACATRLSAKLFAVEKKRGQIKLTLSRGGDHLLVVTSRSLGSKIERKLYIFLG